MEHLTPAIVTVGLATMVAIVGMPHGGLDHLFGRELFRPRFGAFWVVVFGLAYLGTAGLVLLGWFVAPTLTVVLFFLISAIHFGDEENVRQPLRAVEGGMVIWVPLLFRQSEVAELLAWVVPGGDPERTRAGIIAAQPLLWAIAIFFIANLMVCNRITSAVRNMAFFTLFVFAPTLVSFVVYFCCWHSTRELMELARRAYPLSPWRGLRRVMITAAPMAGLAVAATAAAAWWFSGDRGLPPVLVQAVFLGLSAVAVPHILLHAAARNYGADPFTQESGVLRTPPSPVRAIS